LLLLDCKTSVKCFVDYLIQFPNGVDYPGVKSYILSQTLGQFLNFQFMSPVWSPKMLTLESVRTETTTSRGYKSPCIFIEVVLLCYEFCGTLGLQNVGLLEKFIVVIKENIKMQKWKMFLFSLKKVPENGPGTTHIHTFKINKQNFLTSIIVGLNISDHIKNKRK
jgi:hypothetical protein